MELRYLPKVSLVSNSRNNYILLLSVHGRLVCVIADIRDNAQAVYDEAKDMDLLLLETNVSYPTDYMKAGLAPLVIYIRINSMKVL